MTAAFAGISRNFAIELVAQRAQFVAGSTETLGFVSQNRFGGPLDSFAQLADSFSGGLFLGAGIVDQAPAHRPFGALQGLIDILVLHIAGGVVQPFGQERLALLGVLNRLLHPFGEVGQAFSLVGEVLLDPRALSVVAQ